MTSSYILTLACPDRPGLVARVTNELFNRGGNIVKASQFEDIATGRFFMRIVFTMETSKAIEFRELFLTTANQLEMTWRLRETSNRLRVLLLASKFDHCLVDLLYRHRIGEIQIEPIGIISNHPRTTFGDLGAIPFHYLPVSPETKSSQEAKIKKVVEASGAELVVLARYMQILSTDLASYLSGRCINIHHSFLPGFKGAKPYHQAHARGVKIIGATAHYVTSDLDEGPIISQDVEHISHTDGPEDLVRKGRDIERRVLARAVAAHVEGRVLLNGDKTVVFSD